MMNFCAALQFGHFGLRLRSSNKILQKYANAQARRYNDAHLQSVVLNWTATDSVPLAVLFLFSHVSCLCARVRYTVLNATGRTLAFRTRARTGSSAVFHSARSTRPDAAVRRRIHRSPSRIHGNNNQHTSRGVKGAQSAAQGAGVIATRF